MPYHFHIKLRPGYIYIYRFFLLFIKLPHYHQLLLMLAFMLNICSIRQCNKKKLLLIECISGIYGKECNLNCSQFCHGKSCYQTTGECVDGCENGYIGGLCTIRKTPVVIDVFQDTIYVKKNVIFNAIDFRKQHNGSMD